MESQKAWSLLLDRLRHNTSDFPTFKIANGKSLYFYAYSQKDYILVQSAKAHTNSCSIKTERKIDYKQFEGVYNHFDDYVSGVKGVRKYLTDHYGQNTTYTISLIKHVLFPKVSF